MASIKYHNAGKSCEFELPNTGETLFGRSEFADFELQDAAVSRKHFTILESRGQYIIRDLGSHNGTRLNNYILNDEDAILKNGDEIQLTNYSFYFLNTDHYNSDEEIPTEVQSSVPVLVPHGNNDTAEFDDSTVTMQRPLSNNAVKIVFDKIPVFSADEDKWVPHLRMFALDLVDESGIFSCSYKDLATTCISFPISGEVVATRMIARGIIMKIHSEIVMEPSSNPNDTFAPREIITWKLL